MQFRGVDVHMMVRTWPVAQASVCMDSYFSLNEVDLEA